MENEKKDFKLLPVSELLDFVSSTNEESRYTIKKAKSPMSKRREQQRLDFFASVEHYLKQIK